MTAAAKNDRIAVRVSHEQGTLIRRAAEAEGVTVTDFTVHAAVDGLGRGRLVVFPGQVTG